MPPTVIYCPFCSSIHIYNLKKTNWHCDTCHEPFQVRKARLPRSKTIFSKVKCPAATGVLISLAFVILLQVYLNYELPGINTETLNSTTSMDSIPPHSPTPSPDEQLRTEIALKEPNGPVWVHDYSAHPFVRNLRWYVGEDCPRHYLSRSDRFSIDTIEHPVTKAEAYFSGAGYICLSYSVIQALETPTPIGLHEVAHAIDYVHHGYTGHGPSFTRIDKGLRLCNIQTAYTNRDEFNKTYPEINCRELQNRMKTDSQKVTAPNTLQRDLDRPTTNPSSPTPLSYPISTLPPPSPTTDPREANYQFAAATTFQENVRPQWVANFSNNPEVLALSWYIAEDCPNEYIPASDTFNTTGSNTPLTETEIKGYYSSEGYICLAYSERAALKHPTPLALHELAHGIEYIHHNHTNHGTKFIRIDEALQACYIQRFFELPPDFKESNPEINCKTP